MFQSLLPTTVFYRKGYVGSYGGVLYISMMCHVRKKTKDNIALKNALLIAKVFHDFSFSIKITTIVLDVLKFPLSRLQQFSRKTKNRKIKMLKIEFTQLWSVCLPYCNSINEVVIFTSAFR